MSQKQRKIGRERPRTRRKTPKSEQPARRKREKGRSKPAATSESSIDIDSSGLIVAQPLSGEEMDVEAIVVQPVGSENPPEQDRASSILKAESSQILFGKIAVDCGYASQKEIDHCVLAQKEEDEIRSLGHILVEKGVLQREEVEEIVSIQSRNLQKRYRFTGKPLEVSLFGALVVARELATREQVNECLRWQAEIERFGERLSLGELLVARGYLSEADIEKILRHQKKQEFRCNACREVFTISVFEQGKSVRCPHCRKVHSVPETEPRQTGSIERIRRKPSPEEPSNQSQEDGQLSDGPETDAAPVTPEGNPERRRARLSDKRRSEITNLESSEDAPTGTAAVELDKAQGWYLGLGGRNYGPLKLRRIRKLLKMRLLGPHDLFWHDSLDDWSLPGEIPELRTLLKSSSPLSDQSTEDGRPLPPPLRSARRVQRVLARIEQLRERGKLKNREIEDFLRVFQPVESS